MNYKLQDVQTVLTRSFHVVFSCRSLLIQHACNCAFPGWAEKLSTANKSNVKEKH